MKLFLANQLRLFKNILILHFFFVVRADKYDTFEFVYAHISLLGIKFFTVIILDDLTKGQAETVYKACKEIKIEESYDELVIFNIDTIRHNLSINIGNFSSYFDAFYDEAVDPKKWSFCKVAEWSLDSLEQTSEKDKISNWCSTGLYVFGSVRIFCNTYNKVCKEKKIIIIM